MSRLMENDGRYEEVIELLTAFLASTPEPEDADEREVRAQLQGRLGCLYHHIDRFDEALETLEASLQLAEDIPVREILAQIYEQRPELTRNAVDNHRKLLEVNPTRIDSLRALAKIGARQTRYRGYCLYEALSALDALDQEGVDFLASYSPPTLEADAPYPGEISDEIRHGLLSLPMVRGMQEIFATLWEAAPTLFTRDLATLGLSSDQRVSPVADTNLAKVFSSAARALGIKTTTLYLVPASDNKDDFQVVCMAPPAIIVTEAAANKRSILELRFLLGRALELTRPAYILAAGLQRSEFARLFLSLLRAFHPRHMRGRREIGSEAMERAGQLRRAIPFKVARKLGELFRNQTKVQFDSGAWRQTINQSANRVGLALCGDLGTALRLISENDPSLADKPLPDVVRTSTVVRELFTFAVSDAYHETRVQLGMGDSDSKP
jgi:tetratricopeptide (TPR) repeat protein